MPFSSPARALRALSFVTLLGAATHCTAPLSAGVDDSARSSAGVVGVAKIDPVLLSSADATTRLSVIVEVLDPLASSGVAAGARSDAVGQRRHARVAAREADLAARKQQVLESLASAVPSPVEVTWSYPSFRLLCLRADRAQILALAADDRVSRVHADTVERAATTQSVPFTGATSWQAEGKRGAGTAVAIIDAPIQYWNDSFGTCSSPGADGCSIARWDNFSADATDLNALANQDGHGTGVAGIVLAMAPETNVLGLNVFYWDTQQNLPLANMSDVIAALDWVAQNAEAYGIVAANLSLGGDPIGSGACNDEVRYDPFRTLYLDHGVVPVVSSGNQGQHDSLAPPACISLAVAVGAQFDTDLRPYTSTWPACSNPDPQPGEVACFSNVNGMLDMLAPGVWIDAAGQTDASGTSMAAPHVSGALALMQADEKNYYGSFQSAYWITKDLQALTAPQPLDGYRFQRLAMNAGFWWDHIWSFGSFTKEDPDGAIPASPQTLRRTIQTSGVGFDVKGAYLYLEVLHPHPENLTVRLTAPNGKTASVALPAGHANFTGVLGHVHAQGAFAPLAGTPADGTWSLDLEDSSSSPTGYYLDAAVYLLSTQGPCVPSCATIGCGDDGCGGTCEGCVIDDQCLLADTVNPDNPCQACEPSVSVAAWSPLDGATCDDGDACTVSDACMAGACTGTAVECPAPGQCLSAGRCDQASGTCVFDPLPDMTPCDDGDACTIDDRCHGGECSHRVDLPCEPGECEQGTATCDPATGACVGFIDKDDNTPCSKGVCRQGTCVAEGTSGTTPQPSAPGDDAGGCSCSTTRRSPRDRTWVWLLGGAAVLVRRRRRRSVG